MLFKNLDMFHSALNVCRNFEKLKKLRCFYHDSNIRKVFPVFHC